MVIAYASLLTREKKKKKKKKFKGLEKKNKHTAQKLKYYLPSPGRRAALRAFFFFVRYVGRLLRFLFHLLGVSWLTVRKVRYSRLR